MNYKKIGLKCGIEIHRQLNTENKLFCKCKARLSKEEPVGEIKRNLRAVAGELGEIDVAALHELQQKKTFIYKIYKNETCLVETDSEPPHPLNKEALNIVLQIALMLNCEIPEEIQVMRKTVIDGSNTSGFQRTAIIGMNGYLDTSLGKVGITNVALEEEAAQIISKNKNEVVYGLDRLGIPLVEIGTSPDIKSPEHAKEVAQKLGMILKSTGKVKSGIGAIRQDLNVSIKRGARSEIKGVQELNLIPKIIEKEIKRQIKGTKEKTVRRANKDGTTTFLRPLPGASRMYPETDITPVLIEKNILNKIKLPELLEDKKKKYEKILNKELASQIINSPYVDLFDKYSKTRNSKIIANILVNTIPDIKRRENLDISKITEKHLEELFDLIGKGKITKDSVYEILKEIAKNTGKSVKDFKIETISENEAMEIIRKIIKKEKTDKINVIIGEAMKKLKGKIDGKKIAEIVKEEIKK